MARRAALTALVLALTGCGGSSGGNWTCQWQCNSSVPPTSGTATYPANTNVSQQCAADHGAGCNDFNCNCNQN